tara:strand:+ start:651 stop:1844 length:1194 start_codon:yes stop_codon:yes gene_type:complete
MNKIPLVFIGLLTTSLLYSQEIKPSIKDSVLHKESKIERIENLRSLMIDAVVEEDFQRIAWIKNHLIDSFSSNYVGLYFYETVALDYLSSSFVDILPVLLYLDTNKTTYRDPKLIIPRSDQLGQQLNLKLFEKKDQILTTLKNSFLSTEQKDILHINYVLWVSSTDTLMTQDSLNSLSKSFIKNHAASPFLNYVKTNALYEYTTSKWGLGFEFFTGFGWFDGALSNSFNTAVPVGIAFDIQYKFLVLSLRNYIGFTKTQQDIQFREDIWEANQTALIFLPEASFGFNLLDAKRIKLYPFAGISSMDLGPTLNLAGSEEFDKLDLEFTSAPCVGISFDYKIKKAYNIVSVSGEEDSYSYIRIRYSYHRPNYTKRFEGGFHSICVGFGAFGRKIKRNVY